MDVAVSYVLLFLFGTIIASFINAAVFRFNTGRGLRGRSSCMTCGATLKPQDLVPVLSYILLRGKCRSCGAKISLQYPLVEVSGGTIAVLCYMRLGDDVLLFSFSFLIWMLLLFIFVYDLRHKIIPDSLSYTVAVLSLLSLFVSHRFNVPSLAAGPLLGLPLLMLSFFSKGRAMGWGDGKLMVGLGWFLGLSTGFAALLFSFWVGMISALILLLPLKLGHRRLTMKSEIPYAPFLIIGAAIAYFTYADTLLFLSLF